MLPQKIFQNLHAVMAILVLFRIIFTQILFQFFDPNSECFAKYDAFCPHIFDYACLSRKSYCCRKDSKFEKNSVHRKHF